MPRVCIIGLDCLTPQVIFDRYWHDLPNIRALAASGIKGRLRSCHPPITVPAWSSMMTGCSPGELGVYGFDIRTGHGLADRRMASSLDIQKPSLWQVATSLGLRSRILGVPQTYPARPLRGTMVSCFLTPPHGKNAVYPPRAQVEIEAVHGPLIFDVEGFRNRPKDTVLAEIYAMTQQRFRIARSWVSAGDWDLLAFVDMGPDRLQHAFWSTFATDHPNHDPASRFASAIRDYTQMLDTEIGTLLALLEDDDTVLLVSDHGATTMHGGFALNEWLIDEGLLTLKNRPSSPRALHEDDIDWSRTMAFAEGGYVGRVTLNIAGRQPYGILPAEAAPRALERLAERLRDIKLTGQNDVSTPAQDYPVVEGIAPDLTVVFGNFAYRALGTVGPDPSPWLQPSNDTGADEANHAPDGIIVARGLPPGCAPAHLSEIFPICVKALRSP